MAETDNITVDEGVYVPFEWIDDPDDYTPITAERMNHIEQGIAKVSQSCDSISRRTWTDPDDKVSIIVKGGTAHVKSTKPVTATAWNSVRLCTLPEWLRPAESHGAVVAYGKPNDTPFVSVLMSVNADGSLWINPTNQTFSNEAIYGELAYPLA